MNTETKATKETQNLGPVASDLHRKLKTRASEEGKSLRAFLEDRLGPSVGWVPVDKAQLNLTGVE